VGLLAGELGSGGNLNLQSPSPAPHPGPQIPALADIFHKIDPAILASVITVLVITGLVLFLLIAFVSSVMRFVLFDGVLTRECHIRAGWSHRQDNEWKYFLWQMGLITSPMFYISAFFEAHRDAYYDRLRAISRDSNWTDWCQFFLRAVQSQAEDNQKKATAVLHLYETMKPKIVELTRSQYAIHALDWIFGSPGEQ